MLLLGFRPTGRAVARFHWILHERSSNGAPKRPDLECRENAFDLQIAQDRGVNIYQTSIFSDYADKHQAPARVVKSHVKKVCSIQDHSLPVTDVTLTYFH